MTHLICVDLQNDFASKNGLCYQERPSVDFIEKQIIPYFVKNGIKITEVISDYRLPLIKATKDKCVPGTWGYQSIIPQEIKKAPIRVKALQSACRIRENGGDPHNKAGVPYHNPAAFDNRLNSVGIDNKKDKKVIIFGLTLDCCVLCLAQELHRRNFEVYILEEGTDTYFGDKETKEQWLDKNIFYRAKRISREEAKNLI